MKIKLTDEQKAKMDNIFELINELSADEQFMEQLNWAQENYDYDDDNEDAISLANFTENLIDTTKNSFGYFN